MQQSWLYSGQDVGKMLLETKQSIHLDCPTNMLYGICLLLILSEVLWRHIGED